MTFTRRYQQQGGSQSCAYNKTWPKQHCTDEEGRVFPTQDDQQVQYVDVDVIPQQSRPKKKKHRDRSPGQQAGHAGHQPQPQGGQDYPCFREREYLVSTGSRHYETQSKAAHDPIPAIEEVGRYIEQAENRAKSVKDIARDLAKDRAALQAEQEHQQGPKEGDPEQKINPENIPPPPPNNMENTTAQPAGQAGQTHNLQTFNPQASTKPEVQLQQEHIQYIDNECCQVAVGVSSTAPPTGTTETATTAAAAAAAAATLPRSRQPGQNAAKSKTGTLSTAQMNSQFGTLERNMAEAAERSRQSRAELAPSTQTLDRRSRYGDSCDTCDAPLTPASLAGIDHRDLEHRPLTRSVTRATVYDEPPEK